MDDAGQRHKDLLVIETLKANGDDGSARRQVDHWIYFDDRERAQAFIAWAQSEQYIFDDEHSHATDDGRFCVRLQHHGSCAIDDIGSHTVVLSRKADEHGGEYDGWEVPVVRRSH